MDAEPLSFSRRCVRPRRHRNAASRSRDGSSDWTGHRRVSTRLASVASDASSNALPPPRATGLDLPRPAAGPRTVSSTRRASIASARERCRIRSSLRTSSSSTSAATATRRCGSPATRCAPSSCASRARSRAARRPTAGRCATGSSTRRSCGNRENGRASSGRYSKAIPACRSDPRRAPGRLLRPRDPRVRHRLRAPRAGRADHRVRTVRTCRTNDRLRARRARRAVARVRRGPARGRSDGQRKRRAQAEEFELHRHRVPQAGTADR